MSRPFDLHQTVVNWDGAFCVCILGFEKDREELGMAARERGGLVLYLSLFILFLILYSP